ncbi:hypothetical protein DRQ36_11085 [bacterium]|nr:MAG: hypothetical protein DRQ36_11085 [bacterium]
MKYRSWIFVLFVLIFAGCGSRTHRENNDNVRAFPDFKNETIDGKKYSRKEISRGPAVVSFLVSWCLTCGYELVALEEIREEFESKELPVIIFTYEDPGKFDAIKDSLKINIPVIHADSSMFAALEIDAIPTRILLLDGFEVKRIVGAPNHEENAFRATIREKLGLPHES